MNQTTLNELLQRLKRNVLFRGCCQELYRQVAAGKREPVLRDNAAVLAAQAMTILFDHVDKERTSGKD